MGIKKATLDSGRTHLCTPLMAMSADAKPIGLGIFSRAFHFRTSQPEITITAAPANVCNSTGAAKNSAP